MQRQHHRYLILVLGYVLVAGLIPLLQPLGNAQTVELLICRGEGGVLRNPDVGQDCDVGETAYLIEAVLRDPPPPPPPTGEEEPAGFEGTVEAHNVWRQAVGVPDLVWSSTVATTAQEWADYLANDGGCALEHRPSVGENSSPYGENLYQRAAFPDPPVVTPKDVVDAWGSESQYYDAFTHTCEFGEVCGHYTQVVWRDTQSVGCGMSTCETDDGFHAAIWVCNYDPAGNVFGQEPF